MAVSVDLGFSEKVEDDHGFKLTSKYFPSKVGGKPAWLSLRNLPKGDQMNCSSCSNPLMFFLQIYAPLPKDMSFHRTLYVFCCYASDCQDRTYQVFRSQLSRSNDFYTFEPPNFEANSDSNLVFPEQFKTATCNICGCWADKKCGSCHQVSYCSRSHQILDWKDGGHQVVCKNLPTGQMPQPCKNFLFPQYDIVIEGEDVDESSDESGDEQNGDMEEYQKTCQQLRPGFQNENMDTFVDESTQDRAFMHFLSVTKKNRDQIVRYYRYENEDDAVDPLWVSDSNQLNFEPPVCEHCGSKRRIEFQVMPQILNMLGNVGIDFGTLLIYTCRQSCDIKDTYAKEFIWSQTFSV
ncbi:Programmed cell death protein 2 [Halotydeus destructor]|nr:Programmed cell death protein 2 [Halotydeus destructor]